MLLLNKSVCGVAGSLCILASINAIAYDVNKDLKNLGPDAYDIAVILSGRETITNHYDGYPNGRFGSFSYGPVGQNTMLHWKNFSDGVDGVINNGQVIHVGWSTADHQSNVYDMFWTDACGRRIPGSVVFNITSGWTYDQSTQECQAVWNHRFKFDREVEISNIRFALLDQLLPLEELNAQNELLARSLRPIDSCQRVVLKPTGVLNIPIPGSIRNMPVVLVYDVYSEGSHAYATDFVQFVCNPTTNRPRNSSFTVQDLNPSLEYVTERTQGPGCE